MQLKDTQLFRQQAFIDGAWVDADNGQTINVNNPATGEILGTVPKMGTAETRRAIEAGKDSIIQPLIQPRQCCIHTEPDKH